MGFVFLATEVKNQSLAQLYTLIHSSDQSLYIFCLQQNPNLVNKESTGCACLHFKLGEQIPAQGDILVPDLTELAC